MVSEDPVVALEAVPAWVVNRASAVAPKLPDSKKVDMAVATLTRTRAVRRLDILMVKEILGAIIPPRQRVTELVRQVHHQPRLQDRAKAIQQQALRVRVR